MDLISVDVDGLEQNRYVLVAEPKRSSIYWRREEAVVCWQSRICMICATTMLAVSEVYGFAIQTGKSWRIDQIRWNSFCSTNNGATGTILFSGMEEEKQEWMMDWQVGTPLLGCGRVECIYVPMLVALAS